MENNVNIVWLIITYLMIEVLSSTNAFHYEIKRLKNVTSFECKLKIENVNWTMVCESQDTIDSGSIYYVMKLRGAFEDPTSALTYDGLLNSTSIENSEFYSCDSQWRYFLHMNPSALQNQCQRNENYREFREHLLNLRERFVKKVQISHFRRVDVAFNILSQYSRLEDVSISGNSIPALTSLPFEAYHNSVTSLNLEHNDIVNVSDGVFNCLRNLSSLYLSHNLIKDLRKEVFEDIYALSTLDVSHNLIDFISNDTFSKLPSLKYIFLDYNKLKVISGDMFSSNNLLSAVHLSNNDLKRIPKSLFENMSDLKNISCSNCSLLEWDKDIFRNSYKLLWVNFSYNHLQELHADLFTNLKQLQMIDLGNNNLSYLGKNLFPDQYNLMYLNLSNNAISSFQKSTFTGAPHIKFLDLSRNKLKSLTDDHIKNFTDLEYFELQRNKLVKIELGVKSVVKIRRIDISKNRIKYMNIGWRELVFMENFNADDNQLTSINLPPCIPSVKQTLTFSFRRNRISEVGMKALILDENRARTDRTMAGCFFNGMAKNFIDLTQNPLLCDCKLYPFYKYVHKDSPRRYQLDMLIDKGNLTCGSPLFLKNKRLVSLSDDMLSCAVSENCPSFCHCGIRCKDNRVFVNCSSRYLTDAPQTAPNGTTVLYIDGNNLTSIISLNNHIWNNLRELHADENSLENLDEWEFPSTLRYLSVRGNKLKILPRPLMHFISNLTFFQLFFGKNDQICNCDRKNFKNFLLNNIQFVEDVEDILCAVTNNDTSELLPLTSVPDSDLCPVNLNRFSANQNSLIISLCIFFILLIIIVLMYYHYQELILSFLYIHCDELFRFFYTEENDEKMFDAFVAYSSSDREIVLELLQELENNPPYFRLCIHERNWLPGNFITDNIVNSVENSKRTIVILSNTFISSPWFNVELRAAVFKTSKDKMSKIINILADKSVSLDSVDPEVRHVISKRTYLVWGERWFWEKLRYAMPRTKKIVKLSSPKRKQLRDSISEVALMPEI